MKRAPATTPDTITTATVVNLDRWRAIYGPPMVWAVEPPPSRPLRQPPALVVASLYTAENAAVRVVEGRALLLRVHPERGRFCDWCRQPYLRPEHRGRWFCSQVCARAARRAATERERERTRPTREEILAEMHQALANLRKVVQGG